MLKPKMDEFRIKFDEGLESKERNLAT